MLKIRDDIMTSEGIFMSQSPNLVFLTSELKFIDYKKLLTGLPKIISSDDEQKVFVVDTKKGQILVNREGKELFKGSKFQIIGGKYIVVEIDSITFKVVDTKLNEIFPKIIGEKIFSTSNSFIIYSFGMDVVIIVTPDAAYKTKGRVCWGSPERSVIIESDEMYKVYNSNGDEILSTDSYWVARELSDKMVQNETPEEESIADITIISKVVKERLKEKFPEYADEFQDSLLANIAFLESKGINLMLDLDDLSLKETKFQRVLRLENNDITTWIPVSSDDFEVMEDFARSRKNPKSTDK